MIAREKLLSLTPDSLVVCNHSGGKDSQAMFKWLYDHVPHKQLIVVHAHLPEVEWEGTIEHIHKTSEDMPVHVVQANKTFFEMIEDRGMWPSPKYRLCTSSLKREPIAKFIRNYTKKHGYTRVYNCLGLRAEESSPRSKQELFKVDKKLSTRARTVYQVLPIHDYKIRDVFASYDISIEELYNRRILYKTNQAVALQDWPFIWTYLAGMSRHSCKICIMSKRADLTCSAQIDPENFEIYLSKEIKINHQFITPNHSTPSLAEIYKASKYVQLEIA